MKLSINKLLIGLLFVFSVILIPTNVVKANVYTAGCGNNIWVDIDLNVSVDSPNMIVTASGGVNNNYGCYGGIVVYAHTDQDPTDRTMFSGAITPSLGGAVAFTFATGGYHSIGFSGNIITDMNYGIGSPSMTVYIVPPVVPPPPPAPVLSVQVFADGLSAKTVAYDHTATITWKTSADATACTCTYSPVGTGNGSCGSGIGSQVQASGVPANLKANTTFSVNCVNDSIGVIPPSDPIYTNTGYVCPSYYPTCFIADTVVQMADGTNKNIQDVKIGDILKGEKTNNKVLGFHDPKLNDKKLYSFNGGRYFVTAEHPFKTIDGWKSINPVLTAKENIGITVTELKVGDTLITETGKVLLKTIDSKNDKADTQLYNFILDGDHTYYADGYLVHNKLACVAGQVPNIAGGCDYCGFSCPSGYTKSCTGGATLCTQDYCGGYVTTYNCTGTVAGSSPTTYEGQSCNQFGTQATCQQGWLTHGCSWNGVSTPDGVCSNAAGSFICTKQKTAATCSAISSCQWAYTNAR
jgi:hypothetical protein